LDEGRRKLSKLRSAICTADKASRVKIEKTPSRNITTISNEIQDSVMSKEFINKRAPETPTVQKKNVIDLG
jgi:hypothetical protein